MKVKTGHKVSTSRQSSKATGPLHTGTNLGAIPRIAKIPLDKKPSLPHTKSMTYKYEGEQVLVVKNLNIKDGDKVWVQIEFLTGDNKGMRKPIAVGADKIGAIVQ